MEPGNIIEFDLNGAISSDGTYTVAIDSPSGDGVAFRSSEATSGQRPLLLLTLASGPVPQVDIVQPADGATFFVGDSVTLQATELHTVVPALLAALADSGHPLTELRTHSATLEDVFVSLTGRHLRDE